MLPDPETHRPCIRCKQWFEKSQGLFDYPEVFGPVSGLRQSIDSAIGDESDKRFICFDCDHKIRLRRRIIFGTLGALVIGILLAEAIGWID